MKCDTSPGRVRYAALLCAVTATIYWFVSSTEDGAGFVNMLPRQQMTKLDTCAARSSAARFFVDNVACECGDIDNDGLFPNMTGLVRPPTPGSRTLTGWIPDLHAAATSQSFPELRMHLSGRPTASIGGISELIDSYAQLHRRIMSGELPANFLAVSGRDGAGTQKGKGFSLGGIGDRIKGWRMAFYLAILSKRALLLEDWQSFPLESVFEPYRVNWTVPDAMRQKLSVRECLKLGNMVPATDDAVTVASLAARAFTGEALECIVTNGTHATLPPSATWASPPPPRRDHRNMCRRSSFRVVHALLCLVGLCWQCFRTRLATSGCRTCVRTFKRWHQRSRPTVTTIRAGRGTTCSSGRRRRASRDQCWTRSSSRRGHSSTAGSCPGFGAMKRGRALDHALLCMCAPLQWTASE
jgi:hypothetical protein